MPIAGCTVRSFEPVRLRRTPRSRLSMDRCAKQLAAALILSVTCALPVQADPALDALVAAYPALLSGYDENILQWKDGTRMAINDGRSKSFEQLLDTADIK